MASIFGGVQKVLPSTTSKIGNMLGIEESIDKTELSPSELKFYDEGVKQFLQASKSHNTFVSRNDPTYLTFKLFFHFSSSGGLLADELSKNSALAYLKRIGETERYEKCLQFKQLLSRINSLTPWLFQELEGLDEVWSTPTTELLPKDKTIRVNCMETIDLKITSLHALYREIAYDHENRRWILPLNLRRFGMSVYVFDSRIFGPMNPNGDYHAFLRNKNAQQPDDGSHVLVDFGACEFTFNGGKEVFGSLNANDVEMNKSSIEISYSQFHISSIFKTLEKVKAAVNTINPRVTYNITTPIEGNKTVNGRKANFLNTVYEKLKDTAKDKLSQVVNIDDWKTRAEGILDTELSVMVEKARGTVYGLYMGNVFGVSLSDFNQIMNDTTASSIYNIVDKSSTVQSVKNGTKQIKDKFTNG